MINILICYLAEPRTTTCCVNLGADHLIPRKGRMFFVKKYCSTNNGKWLVCSATCGKKLLAFDQLE